MVWARGKLVSCSDFTPTRIPLHGYETRGEACGLMPRRWKDNLVGLFEISKQNDDHAEI